MLTGAWQLEGHHFSESDVQLPHYSLGAAITTQLNTASKGEEVVETSQGLILTILPSFKFSESGSAVLPWFSADGVLEPQAEPFSGVIHRDKFLIADSSPPYATPAPEGYNPLLRLDDGDTKVSDLLRWFGKKRSGPDKGPERLVRTVNVVTDQMYLTRVVYKYGRVD